MPWGRAAVGEKVAVAVVPGYRVVRQIAAGGMGRVYEAEKTSTHETFAVKVIGEQLLASDASAVRFEREISALRAIRHPNVVNVFEWCLPGPLDLRNAYVVMELLRGESLEQVLAREGAIAPWRAVQILLQILDGLAAAHGVGVLHRDLGPSNVFLQDLGDGKLHVKLLDFGLARPLSADDIEPALTREGTVMGKPGYVPPEVFLGRPFDERGDIFACGMILYRALAGRLPHKEAGGQLLWIERYAGRNSLEEHPSPRLFAPGIPEDPARVAGKAVCRRPERRYGSAREMQADLLEVERRLGPSVVPDPGVPSPPASRPETTTTTGRLTQAPARLARWSWRAALGTAAAVCAAAVALLFVEWRGSDPPGSARPLSAASGSPQPLSSRPVSVPAPAGGVSSTVPGPPATSGSAAPAGWSGVPGVVPSGGPASGSVSPAGGPRMSDAAGPVDASTRTVRLTFERVPPDAHVTVAGREVDPRGPVEVPMSVRPILVEATRLEPGYRRFRAWVVPSEDRRIPFAFARDSAAGRSGGPADRASPAGTPPERGPAIIHGPHDTTFVLDPGGRP